MTAIPSAENPTNHTSQFTESTYLQLIEIVLGNASPRAGNRQLDQGALHRFFGLANDDPTFAHWLSLTLPDARHSVQDAAGSRPILNWDQVLSVLQNLGQPSVMAACVRQAASNALRLRTLQVRFGSELDHSKREAIYQLAYGLSHELNNPLANIVTRAGVLLSKRDHPDERHMLETIIDSASRGSEMLGDLMLIARPPTPQLEPLDLAEYGQHVLSRGRPWASVREVALETDWQPTEVVRMDPAMLNEIVWALIRNAIEVSIDGSIVRLVAFYSQPILTLQVEDQGSGLSIEALKHCFDPYYSGREAGRGLGMGLSKVMRFAQILGGGATIENRSTGGCRATVWVAAQPHTPPMV